MKSGHIILIVLLICSLMLGCQAAVDSNSLATDGNMLQIPSPRTTLPSTSTLTPSIPVTVPTTPPTQPIEPPINQKVTPINTYVNAHTPTGMINYENRISIPEDYDLPFNASVPLGEVGFSPNILKAMEENPDSSVCCVSVFFLTTFYSSNPDADADIPSEQIDMLKHELMTRFEEAGYTVQDHGWYAFYVHISIGQLKELTCGDDVAVYIYSSAQKTY